MARSINFMQEIVRVLRPTASDHLPFGESKCWLLSVLVLRSPEQANSTIAMLDKPPKRISKTKTCSRPTSLQQFSGTAHLPL